MENVQLHIWQLEEKTDSVDRDKDVIMVHDKYALKKASLKKLFEYLNQDYKIESTIAFFDNQMKIFDDKYYIYYALLEVSLNEYDKILEDLESKFTLVRDKIREVETNMNIMYKTIITIDNNLKLSDNKHSILFDTLNSFNSIINDLDKRLDSANRTLNEYENTISEVSDEYIALHDDSIIIESKIETIKESIKLSSSTKTNELLHKIYSEYDKVLSILDYYHHIHDKNS